LKLSIPYSRKRRYLTGIDWVLGAMNHIARKSTGIGAISQAVLDVDGRIDEKALRAALHTLTNRFPLIHGKISRDFVNLAPYWRIPRSAKTREIPLRVVDLPEGAGAQAERVLNDHANSPFDSESQHLRFLLVRIGGRSRLGMVFDHRLFDAFGAESFLQLIDLTSQGRLEEFAGRVRQTEPAHLDHWVRRFKSGRKLIEHLFPVVERDVCALARPAKRASRRVCFVQDSLTNEETARFDQRASEESGLPMVLPSAAARAVMAFRNVYPTAPLDGEQYLIFTSANTRSAGQEWESLFFNQFSFLFFSAQKEAATSAAQLAVVLRDQLFEMMKQNIAFAMQDAAALWRIFPHRLVSAIMHTLGKGRMCSLYFACVRESGFPGHTFMGLPATNLTHAPLAFSPPGFNICMTQFAGRFNLVLSYVQGALNEASARRIMQEFKRMLLS
jgi:hypothetical protein